VRALDLVTVQDGRGMEFDLGELVTWLSDAVLIAPSMLLVAAASWSSVEDGSFDVAFTDAGHTVTARVFVDAAGAPTDFHTRDRWYAPPGGPPVRTLWTTPVEGWRAVDGRRLFTRGRATWRRPEGDFTYAEVALRRGDVAFNVAPGG
jgi:hypothetical protein